MEVKIYQSDMTLRTLFSEKTIFDPDKRIDSNQKLDKNKDSGYNIDKRLEIDDSKINTGSETENESDQTKTPESSSSDNANESKDNSENNEASEKELEKLVDAYLNDLHDKSDCPETIPDKPFEASDLEKKTPEENAAAREEFNDKKAELKKEWEKKNGRPWPKYENDVYSSTGKLIRRAGTDYDAHHIQPLSMGGKNEANNITPLHANVHYDRQGVHSTDSPYNKIEQNLGGSNQ